MWSGKVTLFERCLQVIMCGPSFVVRPPRLRLIALGLPLEVRVTFSADRPCGLALTSTAYWLNRSVGTFPKFDRILGMAGLGVKRNGRKGGHSA